MWYEGKRPSLILIFFWAVFSEFKQTQIYRIHEECSSLSFALTVALHKATKYIHIKSTTVYVPSSELGLSHPLSRQRVCPSPRNQRGGGAHSCAGEGLGESQFQRLEKKFSTLPTLCIKPIGPMYIAFCRLHPLFPHPPPQSFGPTVVLPVISLFLSYTVSLVRAYQWAYLII